MPVSCALPVAARLHTHWHLHESKGDWNSVLEFRGPQNKISVKEDYTRESSSSVRVALYRVILRQAENNICSELELAVTR